MNARSGWMFAAVLFAGCVSTGTLAPRVPAGIGVATRLAVEPSLAVSSDEAGSALVAYTRADSSGPASVLVQKYSPSGEPAWGASGVAVSTAAQEPGRLVLERGSGGWFAAWRERRGDGRIWKAQRLSDDGRVLWPAPLTLGALWSGSSGMDYTATADGSLLLVWNDVDASSRTVYIALAKATPDGDVAWTRAIGKGAVDSEYQRPKLDWDEAGGAFLSYRQVDQGDRGLMLQHFSSAGEPLWDKGRNLYDGGGYKSPALLFGDTHGGVVVAWEDGRSGDIDVYSQRVGPAGAVLWAPEGVPIARGEGNQWSPTMVPDGSGGVYVVWIDNRGARWELRGQRLGGDGASVYPRGGVRLGVSSENQGFPLLARDGGHGALACWYESRLSDYGVYCQRLTSSGGLAWGPEGTPLAVSGEQKTGLRMTADGRGGAVVAWKCQASGLWEVRAQKLEPAGGAGWQQ